MLTTAVRMEFHGSLLLLMLEIADCTELKQYSAAQLMLTIA